jgi:hypothetical protein
VRKHHQAAIPVGRLADQKVRTLVRGSRGSADSAVAGSAISSAATKASAVRIVVMMAAPRLIRRKVYRGLALCLAEAPSILKGGDHVKFIIATLTTFAVTATGIVPALANCCP